MTSSPLHFNGTSATAAVDTTVYSVLALKKAAYRLADRCSVVIGVPEETRVAISFTCAGSNGEDAVRDCVRRFFEEAGDYDLRERIANETAPLRNLILAHAFSRTKLIEGSGD